MLYLFFGEDEFACEEALRELESDYWSDPGMADLNRTLLDGRSLTLAELRHHCDAIPFLAERRLVIVEKLITRLDGNKGSRSADADEEEADELPASTSAKELLDALLAYLPNVPDTTDLVLIDAGLGPKQSRGRIARWAAGQEGRSVVKQFSHIKGGELQKWIAARVKQAGGQIERPAAARLAQLIGDDLRALSNEIDKLILFPASGEPITADLVQRMVANSQEASIFDIVEAIGNRKWESAIARLRQILYEGAHPLYVFSMIQWQYRLIAQAHALADERLSVPELAKRMGVKPYPAEKAQAQARRYTREQLVATYDRMLETDLAIKTGKLDPSLALELFITGQAGLT
jgi:DNA polymerase III subunit delta